MLAILLGLFAFTPTFRRQIEALATEGANSTEYQQLAARSQMLGIVIAIIVIIIVFFMVTKPGA